jgi:hypothetical protein
MNRSYFVVVVLALAIVVGLFACTGLTLLAFVDLPSLGVVLLPAVVMGFAAHSPRETGRAYRVAFSKNEATREELGQAEAYFDGLTRYLACGAALGIVVGFVTVLLATAGIGASAQAIEDRAAGMGRGVALSMICVVYALMLIVLVALPFRTAIRKRLAAA